jgi:hypothetical protein
MYKYTEKSKRLRTVAETAYLDKAIPRFGKQQLLLLTTFA